LIFNILILFNFISYLFQDRDILPAVIEENVSPSNFPKSFHKLPKKWKAKSEMGGRMFVKWVEG